MPQTGFNMRSPTTLLVAALLATFLFVVTSGQTQFGKPCEGPQSEIYCHGEFFFTVQRAKLYPDQKTFPDRPLKFPPQEVLNKFKALNITGENLSNEDKVTLGNFIDQNFDQNGTEFEPWDPTDWKPNPTFLDQINNTLLKQWASELHEFWKELGRKIKTDVRDQKDQHSMYYVSHPVIVPGGRFKEFYYWDSYWIQRGLLISNMTETVKGMILNFFEMVETLGFIPNGGRIYYQRSQPPLLLPMVDGYYEHTQDLQFIKDNIGTMIKEFNFFLNKRTVNVTVNGETYRMGRYNVELTEPRPESFSEDYELVNPLPLTLEEEQEMYANLKTGAESGWDFSSRWYVVPEGEALIEGNLTHTKTRDMLPVDLNSFLYWNSALLEKFCGLVANQTVCKPEDYRVHKEAFKAGIRDVLWDEELGAWFDYDFVREKRRKYFYPTNITPLWVGAQHGTMEAVGKRVVNYLHASGATNFPGGVPTSMVQTGLQWDFPNGWAPLNHIVVEALEKSGEATAKELAFQLAEKWTRSNHLAYLQTEAMFEKYDVSIVGAAGSGGEYEVVVGFGWSNGVILDFLNKYGNRLTPATNLPETTTIPATTPDSSGTLTETSTLLTIICLTLYKIVSY